ncbi:hypothetical protein B0H10DRAFT_1996115 [Mycena sp. CBHHK59/15]|nr:hypothetical protein B0H10DRAFT_1996115 [Mycena sp. CBHHK59/15]
MAAQRSPHTPSSSIPTRTSKPISLLPTPRRPSLSSPAPSSPNTPAPVSGFRALRSLLPFGPNKHATPISPSVSQHPNNSRFASFSSVRKSITRERNASFSSSALPVMVIDRSTKDSGDYPIRKSISLYEEKPSPVESTPPADLPSEIPTLNFQSAPEAAKAVDSPTVSITDEKKSICDEEHQKTPAAPPLPSLSPSPSPTSPNRSILPHDPSPGDESSALDLSTTHLASQVLDAMKAQENAAVKAWLDTEEEPSRLLHSEPDHPDVSFNLGSLDPDLAALLSPNRLPPAESNDTIRARPSVDLTHSPFLSAPPSPHHPQHQSSRPRLRPTRPSTPPSDINNPRSACPPSPLSTSHPPSPTLSSAVPTSATPTSPLLLSSAPPVTSSTPASVRRPQYSSSASSSQTTGRRPALGRMLQSDSWESTPSSRSALSRPSLDSAGYRPSSSASASRTSLDTTRHRPSLDTNRPTHLNGNNNTNGARERPSQTPSPSWNTKLRRSRKRSMSVDERTSPQGYTSPHSERPGSSLSNRPEWLGPRTAKAFKAAGLLGSPDSADGTDAPSPPAAGRSKFGFGSVRSVGRSDSRMGMTSPGTRRGSGSGSYFVSGSQLMESPTLTMSSRDTPRSVSTAPTSVSGASWGRDGDEIRELKDKHAVETGALLSALSDSQRTTKVLREENSELRERLARLEEELERSRTLARENQALREFVSELREEAGQLKLQLRMVAPVSSSSRYLASSTTQPFRLPRGGGDEEAEEENSFNAAAPPFSSTPASNKNQRKRLSSSSSIFPAPPSNMSLLLHEDGANSSDFDSGSASAASPTMVLPRIEPRASRGGATHRHNKSIASVASGTTTSPNASMLGSPRSLLLRPEHEMHLGDMESLDLGRGDAAAADDEEWSE